MISVYDIGNEAFDKNGDVVLTPQAGKVRLIAAGNYDLTMEVIQDREGKWRHLKKEAIVKAPVPKETITTAFTGLAADVYVTTEAAALRSGPSEPTTITYPTWSISATYSVGAKVSWNNKNYQCNYYDETSPYAHIAPPSCSWWAEIRRTNPGSPALVNMANGTELYFVSGPEDGWYKMCTTYGLEGYIKSTQVQYSRHMEPGEIQPRVITEQLFRIKTVDVNKENHTVSINARHVSYDLNGNLMENIKIVRTGPAQALAYIQQAFMMPYRGIIATDMITNEDKDYSAEISGKNGMYALLDPDRGVVSCFDAEFRRDNWDLFVMAKTETDTTWTVQTLRAEMEKQARARFEVDKCDKGLEEITVDFEMMGETVEYPWLKELQSILLYDTVIAIDEDTGISAKVTVSELEYDIVKEKVTGAKMINVRHYNVKNVNGFMVLDNTITGDKLTDEAGSDLMSAAVDTAAEYTDEKASETLSASKNYVGDRHGYGTFESYIKAYCDNRYVRA